MKNYSLRARLATAAACLMMGFAASAQVDVVATVGLPVASYTTLDAAFQAINAGTHQGAIGIGISANTTETGPCVLLGSGAGAANYTSILLSPTADGVSISGPTATGRGLIELKGVDNITIDGDNPNTAGINKNLSIVNTAANTVTYTSCVRIANAATFAVNSDNVLIQNCILMGSATGRNNSGSISTTGSENTTFGIYVGGNGGTSATDAPTAISSVTTNTLPVGTTVNGFVVNNNMINACARAVSFNGSGTTSSNLVTITGNMIGDQVATLTGGAPFASPATTVYVKGIIVSGTTALNISGNTIKNMLSYVGTTMSGIELLANIGAGSVVINNNAITGLAQNVSGNVARGIFVASAGGAYTIGGNTLTNIQSSGSAAVAGIEVTVAGSIIEKNTLTKIHQRNTGTYGAYAINLNGGANHLVQNNFISDVMNDQTAGTGAFSTTFGAHAIRIVSSTGHKIYNNSVHLYGANFGSVSTNIISCLTIVTTVSTGMDIRNNILSNVITGGNPSGTRFACIMFPSGGTSSMNLILNNNAYYGGTDPNSLLAQVGTTFGSGQYLVSNFSAGSTAPATNLRSYTSTLSAAGTNDNASFASTSPAPFISNTNLHLDVTNSQLPNVEQKGDPSVALTTDIDGNVRPNASTTNPDIGADEVVAPGCVSANGGTITPATVSKCNGQTATLTSTGASFGAGISYQWMVSATSGSGYVNVTGGTGATTTSYTTAALTPGVYYYVLQATCSTGPATGLSNEVTVTVNANPTVTVSPSTASICQPGATAVALAAGGASTYAWGPATGLSATTGTSVNALPGASTTYTVTGTDVNGCTATATSAITVSETPSISSVTATPSSVCSGGNSQLQVNAGTTASYTVQSVAHNAETPSGTATNIFTTGDDVGSASIALPFAFNFFGQTYNNLFAYTNGFLELGTYSTSTSSYGATIPAAATPNAVIAGVWDDLNVTGAGTPTVRYFTNGTAPNRRFIVEYSAVKFYNGASNNGNVSFQIKLYEGTNVVEVHVTNAVDPSPSNHYIGIENATGTVGSAPAGRNPFTTNITVPEAWAFLPSGGTLTYAWTPATFLSNTNTANPMANAVTASTTYTVTVSNGTCSATSSVALTAGSPLTSTSSTTPASGVICAGSNITLNSTPAGGGAPYTYAWSGPNSYTATTQNPVITGATVAATGTYTITVTDNCGTSSTTTVNVTVNALPVVTASPATSTFCSGASPIALTAGGATTYAWSPSAGLSATTGTSVNASPAGTTTYTVTGTDGNGCAATATAAITTVETPSITSATATPATLCAGGNSQLDAAAGATSSYTVSSPAFAAQSCLANPGPTGDDNVQGGNAIGFGFNYFGRTYTQFAISTNGNIQLGDGSGSVGNPAYSNAWTDAAIPNTSTPNNLIALAWDDWLTSSGEITWGTTGTAPNRKLVVCFNTTGRGAGSADTLNGQIVLEEMTNKIYLNIIKKGVQAANTATQGIEDATGSAASIAVAGRNNTAWSATNSSRVFTPGGGTITYAWSPATFLSDPSIANPMANAITATTTYTVTASNGGCPATSTVTINVNPVPSAPVAPGTAICSGATATLNATGTGTIGWYNASTGGTHIGSGTSFTTPALTGTATYYVQDSSAAGCVSNRTAVTVTVNPLPTVAANSTAAAVCDGSSVTLTGSGATSYTWSGSVTDGVAFTPSATATYTVTGTDGNGCMNTATTTVTVNPLPTVVANSTASVVCDGSSITLTGSGASSYTWTGSVTDGVAFTPSATDTYTVTGTDGNGCMNTATTTVTVNPLPTVMANSTSSVVCDGSSVTLTGSGASSYTWTGSVTDGVAFTPSATATYTVTGTDGNGCMNTATTTVTVNPLPAVVANSTAAAVCDGGMVTLTGSGASSYTWSGSVADGVAFTPSATDTYTVTGTDGNGCMNTATTTVTVNALPAVVANSTAAAVCDGGMVTLTGGGAASYTWSGSVADGVAFTPVTTDTYTVTGTDGNGCMNTATTTVTVNPLPTVMASSTASTVCEGSSVTLTGSGASSYTWTGSVTDGVAFTPAATDTYTVTGTDGNGCMNTATTTVTVNAAPSVAMSAFGTSICDNDVAFMLTGGSPAGGVYSGTGVSGGMFDPAVSGAGMFVITYTVSDTNTCTASDTATITVDLCSGIASNNGSSEIIVYPNPASNVINISVGNANFSALTISIVDIQGKEVYNETDKNVSAEYNKQINIENLAKGVYYIKMNTGSDSKVQKLIVH
ncbi:MAG: hypothetical protein JWO09_1792 [Bacteroidetes bacterium]|nr:hypothetical protein [Bacteroidota bacterium]